VLGSSDVLQAEMVQLLDFELVIGPLDIIYHKMIKNNAMDSFGFEISAETVREIKANLKTLTEKLPRMALNALRAADSGASITCI
jgi:hypothetical protein